MLGETLYALMITVVLDRAFNKLPEMRLLGCAHGQKQPASLWAQVGELQITFVFGAKSQNYETYQLIVQCAAPVPYECGFPMHTLCPRQAADTVAVPTRSGSTVVASFLLLQRNPDDSRLHRYTNDRTAPTYSRTLLRRLR